MNFQAVCVHCVSRKTTNNASRIELLIIFRSSQFYYLSLKLKSALPTMTGRVSIEERRRMNPRFYYNQFSDVEKQIVFRFYTSIINGGTNGLFDPYSSPNSMRNYHLGGFTSINYFSWGKTATVSL